MQTDVATMIRSMKDIQRATNSVRVRLQDRSIATQAKNGRVQVVRVSYNKKGKSTVSPVSDWMPASDVPAYLGQMK